MHVVWNGDERYPGPDSYALPDFIKGVPDIEEIEAMPDMFTWGEIKDKIKKRDNGGMSRSKALEDKYEEWIEGQKEEWGSAVGYLINARLPWGKGKKKGKGKKGKKEDKDGDKDGDKEDKDGKDDKDDKKEDKKEDKNEEKNEDEDDDEDDDDDDDDSDDDDETEAKDSMAYITFEEIDERQKERGKPPLSEQKPDEEDLHDFLRWDPDKGLDKERFAILPNDWPYSVPYGVRHYVIWCRIAIAHPVLVDYDRKAWEEIEENGLQGFTGVTPIYDKKKAGKGVEKDWYSVDVEHAGNDISRWAGEEFETAGGQEVGRMVKGLWDERGWETVWFVNPPALQSIPGYAHFHVFARRKRPIEIDVSERVYIERQ